MSTQTRLMTAEELFLHGPDQSCELIEGELRLMPPPKWLHGRIVNRISWLLTRFVMEHSLGEVACESGFVIERDPDTVLAPDVSFIASERLPDSREAAYLSTAPDLVVEVVSPSQSIQEVEDKTERWLRFGVKIVWVAWPNTRTISVHRPGVPPLHLSGDQRLEGDEVLRGFSCTGREVFTL